MDALKPLDGVRILDMSWLGVGCIATWLLAEMGAAVIKVEPPDGSDNLRNLPGGVDGVPVVHLAFDRHKKSLALDLRTEEGQAAYRAVARNVDAVIEGFRPGVADRLGVGYEALKAENERIVYVGLSGYGSGGPLSTVAAHDLNLDAQAGVMSLSWPAPVGPPPVQVADYFGATLGALALVSGVMGARATGHGAFVEATLFDGALFSIMIPMAEYLATGMPFTPESSMLIGAWACYSVYECADGGLFTVGALEPRFWIRFCEMTGLGDGKDQYKPKAQAELRERVAALMLTRTRDEWTEFFDGEDVCVAPVLSVEESSRQPHVLARNGIGKVQHPNGSELDVPASPIRFATGANAVAQLPSVGTGTRELLSQADYSDDEIRALVDAGVAAVDDAASL